MWWWVGVVTIVVVVATGQPPLDQRPHLPLMAQFLRSARTIYFPQCTLVFFHEARSTPDPGHDDVTAVRDLILDQETQTPHLIFTLDENVTQVLRDFDLSLVTRCPVYVIVSRSARGVLGLLEDTEKDWDKYFMSRVHIIFLVGELGVPEEMFLNTAEVNTMTNLLLIRPSTDSGLLTLQVQTNTPYDLPKLCTLKFYRGGDLIEGESAMDLLPDKLRDLHGFRMKVVTFHFPPRIFMVEKPGDGTHLYGVDIEVVRALSQALNFTLSFGRPSDGEMWGWEQDNGTWKGLMGDLQARRADIGVADLYIMEQYFSIIDMSVEYDIEYLCFVNPVPGPFPQWMAITLPFLPKTWLAILLSVMVGMVALAVVARVGVVRDGKTASEDGAASKDMKRHGDTNGEELYNQSLYRNNVDGVKEDRNDPAEAWFRQWSNTCLLLYGCVMNTSWIRVPSSSHLRIFVLLWSLAFLILAVAYKGSLVSHLTVPLEQPPINTHRQLYERDVAVGSIGYTLKRVMEKNADRFVRLLAERYSHVPSTTEGLKKTLDGSYSFLESRGFLDYTIAVHHTDRRGKAALHVMREYIAPFGIGLAYPKFVPYIAKFNQAIRRLTEAGLAKRWMMDIILRSKLDRTASEEKNESNPGGWENQEDTSLVRSLTLDDLQGGFILLGLGYGLSSLALVVELVLQVVRGSFKREV